MSPELLSLRTLAALGTLGLLSCGPSSRRELANIPQRQITFDDMCQLQTYFDQRSATHPRPFRAQDEQSIETENSEPDERGHMRRVQMGEGTYIVSGRSARRQLQELLNAEYLRPPQLPRDPNVREVRLHVGWWQSGQMRRLRPDRPITLVSGDVRADLPFNPCVGEFLFGAPVYAIRRHVLDSDSARARGEIPPPLPDETSDSGATSDASVAQAAIALGGENSAPGAISGSVPTSDAGSPATGDAPVTTRQ